MVRPEGFEPPTLGSEDRCSIQLSYGRTMSYTNVLDSLGNIWQFDALKGIDCHDNRQDEN